MKGTLNVLLVDDDAEVLGQLKDLLPSSLRDYAIKWDYCGNFEEAAQRIESRRYDLVVTDVYLDNKGQKKGTGPNAAQGLISIQSIRGKRFCPIIAFSDGSMPEGFRVGPFIKFADKSSGIDQITNKLTEIIDTGIPQIASKLHNELDGIGGEYLWNFLEAKWEQLKISGCAHLEILERLVRRRAAISLGRLDPSGNELENVAGLEFFIHPKISRGELRLGEILREISTGEYRVILTPHCHLTIQSNQINRASNPNQAAPKPKAEFVLTLKAVQAAPLIAELIGNKAIPHETAAREKRIRNLIGSSPCLDRTPEGRYWFIPRFLDMPDLYCDFLQVESLPFSEVDPDSKRFEAVAVLDTPFAEALQARFGQFYASVGTPNLHAKDFLHLLPTTSQPFSTTK